MEISIPSWEDPLRRFLDGLGEVQSADSRRCPYTLWEALLYVPEEDFPLRCGKVELGKDDLLFAALELFVGGSTGEVRHHLGKERFDKILTMFSPDERRLIRDHLPRRVRRKGSKHGTGPYLVRSRD